MTLDEIAALPVSSLIRKEGYLFLWTTNKFLERGFEVCRAWGFTPRQTLVWCKPPNGKGLGGMFATTTEFVIVGQAIREGTNAHGRRTVGDRVDSSWFEWPRTTHSTKPPAFQDVVERVAPGPYLELFARSVRLGWDSWGKGYE
jgi:N6-adenosine-specific RNA methylase IME4